MPRIPPPADALIAWYRQHGRVLPWRSGSHTPPDPYAVLVSELMLQQTRSDTVAPYYRAWMARFPTLASLAAASQDEVLTAWSGLGYYSRARHLHETARRIVADDGGHIPTDASTLRALPGIGAYTAGAVASIAFGRPETALDGNAIRVIARLGAYSGDPRSADGRRRLESAARNLLGGPHAPGDVNQALMDLGSLVCTPRAPRCDQCPLAGHCEARSTGDPEAYPPRTARREPRPVTAFAYVVTRDHDWLVVRERGGLLAGLWGFPMVAIEPGAPSPTPAEGLRQSLDGASPFSKKNPPRGTHPESAPEAKISDERLANVATVEPGPTVQHVFSHIRLTVEPFVGRWTGAADGLPAETHARQWAWRCEADLNSGPVSRLAVKLLEAARQVPLFPTEAPLEPHSDA